MQENKSPSLPLFTGPLLFVVTLMIYMVTMARGPFPGDSAWLLAQHANVDPIAPLGNPIWGALVRLLDQLGTSGLAFRANLLSAILGAGGVWLMYLLVSSIPFPRPREDRSGPGQSLSATAQHRQHVAGYWAGLAAALLLAFSTPYWVLATRAHPLSLSVFLMIATATIFSRFLFKRQFTMWYVFCLVYGLSVVEYPILWFFAPIYLLLSLVGCWQQGQWAWRPILLGALCFTVALLLYPLSAWQFYRDPSFAWFEFATYSDALLAIARFHYRLLMHDIARTGWMLIAFFAVIPWFIVFIPKQVSTSREVRIGTYMLNAVLTALTFLIFYRLDYSPLLYVAADQIIVAPYVLVAMWGGYIIGFWRLELASARSRSRTPTPSGWVAAVFAVLVIGALLGGGVRNFADSDARVERQINVVAHRLLDELGDRTWLISNGALDPNLMLLARERGQTLNLINMSSARSRPYMKYVATLFEQPRKQSLARLNLSALLNEWFRTDPEAPETIAVMDMPDLWISAGFTPLPANLIYLGIGDSDAIEWLELYAEHERFWMQMNRLLAIDNPYSRRAVDTLRRLTGKAANDFGVLLEDEGERDKAFSAYEWARRIDPDNLSALLNMMVIATQDERPELAELEAEVERVARPGAERRDIWRLSALYGYVRNPAAFFARGQAWVASGQSATALRELRRGAALMDQALDPSWIAAISLLDRDRPAESEAALRVMHEATPENVDVLFALFQLTAQRGDLVTARQHLEQLIALEGRTTIWQVEDALLRAVEGDLDTARSQLQSITQRDPSWLRGWAAYALVTAETGDLDAARRAVSELLRIGGSQTDVMVSAARIRMRLNDHEAALQLLERILAQQPFNRDALEMMLTYDWQAARRDRAMERIERLLTIEPNHATANFVLGTIQMAEGAYALAESSFQASLDRRPAVETLINLAWLLQLRGEYTIARHHADQAVQAASTDSSAWHTLGLVLLRQNELTDASGALQQALELDPDNAHARLYTALLFAKQGLHAQSRDILENLMVRDDIFFLPETKQEAMRVLEDMRSK